MSFDQLTGLNIYNTSGNTSQCNNTNDNTSQCNNTSGNTSQGYSLPVIGISYCPSG
jgi:hypothetical protein